MEGVGDKRDRLIAPDLWTPAATASYPLELIEWLLRRLDYTEAPESEAEIFHEAALALDDPSLDSYEKRLRWIHATTTPSRFIAHQLVVDARRPSHRLVGYATAQPLSVATLLLALPLERRAFERFRSTRTLYRALEVLRSAIDAAQVDEAAVRAFAVVCLMIDRGLESPHVERREDCRTLLRSIFQGRELARAAALDRAASDYDSCRRDDPPGPVRTGVMDAMVEVLHRFVQVPSMPEARAWFEEGGGGHRIVGLSLVLHAPDPGAFCIVESAIGASQSAFEQYTALRAADVLIPLLNAAQRNDLLRVLEIQRAGPPGRISPEDPNRWHLSEILLRELAEPRSEPGNQRPDVVIHRTPDLVSPTAPPGRRTWKTAPPQAIERYRKTIFDDVGHLAAWPPGGMLTVGAIGVVADGSFLQLTSLHQLDVKFDLSRIAIAGTQLTSHAHIRNRLSNPDSQLIDLNRIGAYVLTLSRGHRETLMMTNTRAVRAISSRSSELLHQLASLATRDIWRTHWVLISEIINVASATLVLSNTSRSQILLHLRSTFQAELNSDNPEGDRVQEPIEGASLLGSATVWRSGGGATPLYSAVQLRRGKLGFGEYSLVHVKP
jgi:hypothetical protein